MWSDSGQERSRPKLASGSRGAFIKKSVDDICIAADLSESTWDYSKILCSGMIRLLNMGLEHQELARHNNLVVKLLRLGRDMMECSRSESDLFFLGALVDIKICERWRNVGFYQFVLDALRGIRKHCSFLSEKMKSRIRREYRKAFPEDFASYFSSLRLFSG